MKNSGRLLACAFLVLVVSGCFRSPPVRLHTLSALPPKSSPTSAESGATLVAVGPVTLAAYLNHPRLTVRTGPNEISRSEIDRWGSSLSDEVNRVAAENLAVLLDSETVKVMPWMDIRSADFRIQISLSQFERDSDGEIVLRGEWSLLGTGRSAVIASDKALVTTASKGRGAAETASAMSAALAEMCRQIAAGVKEEIKQP
jgi:uncharacterized protein